MIFFLFLVGALFLNKKLCQAIKNLRVHIINDCVSDVTVLVMYRSRGKGKDGLELWDTHRGTNSVENYHLELKDIYGGSLMSPQLAHYIIMLHNYRRNIRMAVKHAGLDKQFEGFYCHYYIEAIQELTAGWFKNPLYQGWLSSKGFVDTGERSGLVASAVDSIASGDAIENLVLPAGGVTMGADAESSPAASLQLTPSAAYYARMQGLTGRMVTPFTKVITQAEKDKIAREWPRFLLTQVTCKSTLLLLIMYTQLKLHLNLCLF